MPVRVLHTNAITCAYVNGGGLPYELSVCGQLTVERFVPEGCLWQRHKRKQHC